MPSDSDQLRREADALDRDTLRMVGLAFGVIRVRYAGPTDTHGSRLIATIDGTRRIVGYDPAMSSSQNHGAAALVAWKHYRRTGHGSWAADDSPVVFIPADPGDGSRLYTVVPEGYLP